MFEFVDVKFKDILNLPSLVVEEKKITTLVGTSGSGKTTFLRMLNKMISPTSGHILYKGEKLADIPSVAHRRQVTMLSQTPAMFEGTVADNLTVGIRFQDRPVPTDDELERILDQVQLSKALHNPVDNLSGGEKQRLALGRVILLDPEVFLLDEPSSALDDVTEEQIIEMLMHHTKESGKSMVLVTHSYRIAERYADSIVEIAAGEGRLKK